ncbi:hypothetical protein [Kocuria sabuli]|uniref:hypothetical protein n=1 Tax=Kocuria sabuli TaxID=3071448 RepID=UPI0034D566F3
MDGTRTAGADTARAASILDPLAREAAFAVLLPVLDTLVGEADADVRLSPDARRVLRAVARTKPGNTLALAHLAARSSTPKTRIPAALQELADRGYLARLARTAPHLTAALPAPTCPVSAGALGAEPHHQRDP